MYAWNEQSLVEDRAAEARWLAEPSAFHVTFQLGLERVHFYFHEHRDNEWEPGGHTSSKEIRRLGHDLLELRERADEIAAAFIEALAAVY